MTQGFFKFLTNPICMKVTNLNIKTLIDVIYTI